ncbi:unnamed protein product [Psylliodes chrysocephalus]|uniref:Uncharacterized protein n=1 Tax=Psylliodes chrysocephalus TaxID=3402493 RepID=A0A9P0CQZ8_9CUCU|nr:unnamed protein product [Psylliodes chrysocephala]
MVINTPNFCSKNDGLFYYITNDFDPKFTKSMNEESQFLSCYGDRLAVMNFCRQYNKIPSNRKMQLIDKLQRKITGQSSKEQERKREKNKRKIEVGWHNWNEGEHKYKQVRMNTGGGTRRILLPKMAKRDEILEKAKNLFFPNGKSSRGNLSEFKIDIQDFTGEYISQHETVDDMYLNRGVTILRFYLTSKKIPCTVTSDQGIDENLDGHLKQNARKR